MEKYTMVVLIAIFGHVGLAVADEESELFQSNDVDCWYKPSCNLTRSSNASLIPFIAGCRCDFDCIKYDDCCKDSKYFGKARVRTSKEYTCHPKLEVFMVSSCPNRYRNEAVSRNCSYELPIKDVSFVVPVTNKRTRTTYANKYCARCHNDTQYEPWDLVVDYVEINPTFFENEYAVEAADELDNFFAADNDSPAERSPPDNDEKEAAVAAAAATAAAQDDAGGVDDRRPPTKIPFDELFSSIRFYPTQESFLANYEDKRFICTFESKLPAELAGHVRRCLPNLVAECADDDDVEENELCRSYTEIVYDRYNALSFRNKDCAACNSVAGDDDTSFCAQNEIPPEQTHRYVISGRNKTRNRLLCENPITPRYYCPTRRTS